MSRKILAVILVLAIAVMAGAVAGCGDDGSKAVATVGDVSITETELNEQVEIVAAQYGVTLEDNPEYYAQLKSDLLEGLIENRVALLKAADLGVYITDEEFQAEIDTMLATWYSGDSALLEEDLKSNDMTLDQFKTEYRDYLLVQEVYESVIGDVTVSDEEIAAYYEENSAYYQVGDSRTVRHILISPAADEEDGTTTTTAGSGTTTSTGWTDEQWSAALALAEEVRGKLVAGGDWTALAAQYSDDTGTQGSGGELGEVTTGEMVAEFEEATFSLDAYEISQPVKSVYGYHIIQVTGITEAHTQPLEEVKDSISEILLSEAQYAAWALWVESARAEVGVVYNEELQPTTTTALDSTTTTAAGDTITTAPPSTTAP